MTRDVRDRGTECSFRAIGCTRTTKTSNNTSAQSTAALTRAVYRHSIEYKNHKLKLIRLGGRSSSVRYAHTTYLCVERWGTGVQRSCVVMRRWRTRTYSVNTHIHNVCTVRWVNLHATRKGGCFHYPPSSAIGSLVHRRNYPKGKLRRKMTFMAKIWTIGVAPLWDESHVSY